MRILGLDTGIASIGWALIETGETEETENARAAETGAEEVRGQILACGVWMFEAAETDKDQKPKNTLRRVARGLRRVIRRRRQRMQAIRRLLHAHGLLPSAARDALALGLDPWELRAEALDRPLAPTEFAAVLGHIARHRGFRSNAKPRAGTNAADEASEMKKAIEATRERLAQWRTVGEMFARDPEFAARRRNREGDFSRTPLRADLEAEVHAIFAAQRRWANPAASPALERDFAELAFSQRPLQDADALVGFCPFIPTERRAARRAWSFERFRLLARLNTVFLIEGRSERRLTPAELARALEDFGVQKQLTWTWLRRRLGLPPSVRFDGVLPEEEKRDIVARSGNAAEGSYALRKVMGEEAWSGLTKRPEVLDEIAALLSFRSNLDSIRGGLASLGLPSRLIDDLITAAEEGKFASFQGAGHISAAAARRLIPHLAEGCVYSEACARAGFDHAARPAPKLDEVRNPVVRRALGETLKQVRAIIHRFGRPDRIHLELARDLGKSPEERREITRGIEKRTKERERLQAEFAELLGREPSREELLRYELWKEQNGRCLYTDRPIPVERLAENDNTVQVDHILPWSRFGDDSFLNKTLCFASANAEKRDRTPFEWFSAEKTPEEWQRFAARVEGCREMKGRKKRSHYLLRHAQEKEEAFRNRNLNDTSHIARLALDFLTRHYYAERRGTRHVFARPAPLTAKLRQAWGLESLKKDAEGKRKPDDRHHALDAIVVAACSESMLNRLTRAFQEAERLGLARDFTEVLPPWPGFRDEVRRAVEGVFVARAEHRRARRKAHEDTVRQVREREGETVVFERRAVTGLKPGDLGRIKDPERNRALIESLRRWIEAGSPKDDPPRSPKGDPIRKVRLRAEGSRKEPGIPLRGGTVSRGEMVRVDVFRKKAGEGGYYLVPVYPHEVATLDHPPNRAVAGGKDEKDWPVMDEGFEFLFSLWPDSLVEAVKSGGERVFGYFRGLDRSTGAISLAHHNNPRDLMRGIGVRTLKSLRKFTVDRFGGRAEVRREARTWRGAVCT